MTRTALVALHAAARVERRLLDGAVCRGVSEARLARGPRNVGGKIAAANARRFHAPRPADGDERREEAGVRPGEGCLGGLAGA